MALHEMFGGAPGLGLYLSGLGAALARAGRGQPFDMSKTNAGLMAMLMQRQQQQKLAGLMESLPLSDAQKRALQVMPPEQATAALRDMLFSSGAQETYGLNPVWARDENGNLVPVQLSNRGRVNIPELPEGLQPVLPYSMRPIDLGTAYGVLDPRAPQPNIAGVIPKDVEGEAAARARGQELGKYEGQEPKRERRAAEQRKRANIVLQDIDRAMEMASFWTTGLIGSTLANVPGTPQHDLSNILITLKSNVARDMIQQMRENSPTGGALGQVSNYENELLMNTLGALEQSQSAEQFRRNMTRLRNYFLDVVYGVGKGPPRTPIDGRPWTPDPTMAELQKARLESRQRETSQENGEGTRQQEAGGAASEAVIEAERIIDGVRYIKRNGRWFKVVE